MEIKDVNDFEDNRLGLEDEIEVYKGSIEDTNNEISNMETAIKNTKDETDKRRLRAVLRVTNRSLESLKRDVKVLEEQLKAKEQEFIQKDPELETYILYEEGKTFYGMIESAEEEKMILHSVANALGTPSSDLFKAADEYAKAIAEYNAWEKSNRNVTLTDELREEEKNSLKIDEKKEKFENAYKKAHKKDRIGHSAPSFDDVLRVVGDLNYNGSLRQSLVDRNSELDNKINGRKAELANVIEQARSRNIRFTGFEKYFGSESNVINTNLPATTDMSLPDGIAYKDLGLLEQKSFWHFINNYRYSKQQESIKAYNEKVKQKEDSYAVYGSQQHDGLTFRKNLVLNELINTRKAKAFEKVVERESGAKKDHDSR